MNLTEVAEAIPAPDGYAWTVVSYDRYSLAERSAAPTLYLEYSHDGMTKMVYLVGQHDLAPEVVTNGQS
ncbi:hypothetical protein [Williamsia sp. D3]|uniref:hypothetical protein n=1 Tax=Williamsia sp. D3 TaxID=1313067 RepID=UPI0003D2DED2|nr:hypothetical protein [Williamsia sp. D3]ETD31510.1 hypothetical protein W823_19125 [Williamsia sp. D3]